MVNENLKLDTPQHKWGKRGYLNSEFKIFHLMDLSSDEFEYHYHDFDKITIFLKGKVRYIIEGRAYDLEPYDIVLINHNEIHKPLIDNSVPYERIIVYISPNFMEAYKTASYDLNYCFEKAYKEHSSVLRIHSLEKSGLFQITTTLEHSFSDTGYANELYRQVLFLEFMIQLNRAALKQKLEYINTSSCNHKITEIMNYINVNLTSDLSIEHLSKIFYISRHYMMRLFKSETGYTIGKYITHKRLTLANQMMQKDIPMTQICFDCGFKDYSTFYRAYKNLYHKSPQSTHLI
ncbi:MAG: AraC family transcriptional regulator [Lachnospiraceae bacterium]